jgi:hypothetical protein
MQTTPDEAANTPYDIQQTHQDEVLQSDSTLNVEMEVIWLGEKVFTACLVLNFNLTLSTNIRRLR